MRLLSYAGKMRKRGCIVSKLLAKMMCKSGLTHVITMDLHQKEIQGFFDCPVDNLRASPFLLQYIQECVSDMFLTDLSTQRRLTECHSWVVCTSISYLGGHGFYHHTQDLLWFLQYIWACAEIIP